MFCSTCGAQNNEQVRFCRTCGKQLISSETLSKAAEQEVEDPYKTRLSMAAEKNEFRSAVSPQQADPMATIVGMPAVKPGQNAQANAQSNNMDALATLVDKSFNLAQLREAAARQAGNAAPAENMDSMQTIVGMKAVMPNANPPAQSQNIDSMQTIVGMPKINANTVDPMSTYATDPSGGDSMATVVGMPAIKPTNLPPMPPPQAEPPPNYRPGPPAPATVSPALRVEPPPTNFPDKAPFKTPSFGQSEVKESSLLPMIFAGIAIVAVIVIVVLFMMKK